MTINQAELNIEKDRNNSKLNLPGIVYVVRALGRISRPYLGNDLSQSIYITQSNRV